LGWIHQDIVKICTQARDALLFSLLENFSPLVLPP
jgi:hypothetical protein